MNKFELNLTSSHPTLKAQRAANLATSVYLAQQDLVNAKFRKVIELENLVDGMQDLGPKTTVDLQVPDINAQDWVDKYQSLKVQLVQARVEYTIAKETLEDLFAELPEVEEKAATAKRSPRKSNKR